MSKVHLRKYGEETTFNFDLFEIDGIDFKIDAVHVSGDTKLMKNEGAEGNTTNGFIDEGQGYSIVLTATEMEHARGRIYIVDQGTKVWLDTGIIIETYGHASAQHPNLGIIMRGTDSASLASVCTEGRLAELDAANLPTDITGVPSAVWVVGTRTLTLSKFPLENQVEDDIIRDSNGNKTSSTIYIYDSAANATTHDKATGLIDSFDITAEYISNLMNLFKSVKN